LTYYGTGLTACGDNPTENDNIVSVSYIIFDAASTGSNPNLNPLCGKIIRAERYDAQVGARRSVDLKVVDRCKLLLRLWNIGLKLTILRHWMRGDRS